MPKGYAGMTIFPFIFIKNDYLANDQAFINHEKIHLRQQLELLIIPFFLWYGLEFLIRYLKCRNGTQAYRNLSFEREAYCHESDLNYLSSRSFCSFYKYL